MLKVCSKYGMFSVRREKGTGNCSSQIVVRREGEVGDSLHDRIKRGLIGEVETNPEIVANVLKLALYDLSAGFPEMDRQLRSTTEYFG